eukprot:COSAG06_NODE_25853_length_627_cov_1.102273_1_plen_22_part_01
MGFEMCLRRKGLFSQSSMILVL